MRSITRTCLYVAIHHIKICNVLTSPFLNRLIYEVYYQKIRVFHRESFTPSCKLTRKGGIPSTCNDGRHAYRAWCTHPRARMIVLNACISHNSLSKDKSSSTKPHVQLFSTQASPRAAIMALAKEPLRLKAMRGVRSSAESAF